MNKIILLGRLTKDPEVRYTPTGKVVCQLTLAVNRPFTTQSGQTEADFIPVLIWGKSAETCGNSLQKGHRLLVEGRLQIRSYNDKNNERRWVSEVVADRFDFIEKRNDQATPKPTTTQPEKAQSTASEHGFQSFGQSVPFDEEIPF